MKLQIGLALFVGILSATGNAQTCTNTPTPSGCAHQDQPDNENPDWTCSSSSATDDLASHPEEVQVNNLQARSTPAYVAEMNTYRCLFCLPPYNWSSDLEASAQTQSDNSVAKGGFDETPGPDQATVMEAGAGDNFTSAVLSWVCEVHTTNIDSCTCAEAYGPNGLDEWSGSGHYEILVGTDAGNYGSIGCVYNSGLNGLWTCALGP